MYWLYLRHHYPSCFRTLHLFVYQRCKHCLCRKSVTPCLFFRCQLDEKMAYDTKYRELKALENQLKGIERCKHEELKCVPPFLWLWLDIIQWCYWASILNLQQTKNWSYSYELMSWLWLPNALGWPCSPYKQVVMKTPDSLNFATINTYN